jgi:DNA-binding IclR family transcriptional regulator
MDLPGASADGLSEALGASEGETQELLEALRDEGFVTEERGGWMVC